MTITAFGIICFGILIILFFLPIRYTVAALLISTIFQSTAVINLADKGITPTLTIEVYLLVRYLLISKSKKNIVREKYNEKMILRFILFFIISIIISIISSFLFENLYIDNVYYLFGVNRTFDISFKLDTSLIIKIIVLFFNISSIYIIYKLKGLYSNEFMKKVVIVSIVIVLFFGFWEYLCKITNNLSLFPTDFIYNNVGYAQGYNQAYIEGVNNFNKVRLNSTFLEPSYCGAFLSSVFLAVLSINKNKKYNKLIFFIILALVFNLSGTGLTSLAISMIFYWIINKKDKIKLSTLLKIIILVLLLFATLFFTGYLERILDMLFNKMDSWSGTERSLYNAKAIEILTKTYFLGGGLNCFRASSFICNMLATVGIIGTVIFFDNIIRYLIVIRTKIKDNDYFKLGFYILLTILTALIISIPDITFLQLWFALFYLVSIKENEVMENEKSRSSNIKL